MLNDHEVEISEEPMFNPEESLEEPTEFSEEEIHQHVEYMKQSGEFIDCTLSEAYDKFLKIVESYKDTQATKLLLSTMTNYIKYIASSYESRLHMPMPAPHLMEEFKAEQAFRQELFTNYMDALVMEAIGRERFSLLEKLADERGIKKMELTSDTTSDTI
jgi:hypothetical protein